LIVFVPTAYRHDSTREELIARFRDRIAHGERTKLSRNERSELILHFIDRLQQCQSEADAKALCEAEISLLEEGYPVPSIANQYMPEYRKAIAQAVEEGRLPKRELPPNEFGKVYPHWGLYYFIYPNAVQKAIKEKTTVSNNQKQDDLQPFRPDRFLAKASDLLNSSHLYDWAVGILATTGRRFSEVVAKGDFSATGHPYAIAFRGQLKKGIQKLTEAETFLIATLVETERVLAAINKFRAHPRLQELANLSPDEINSRLNTSVRSHIKQHFEDTEILPILTGEKAVTAHNLRGAYAEIAVRFFCPPNQGTHRFVQQHLGHIIGESELASRKNAGATEHYFHYYLIGAQRQLLGEKGILLQQVGALPTRVEPQQPEPMIEIETELEEPEETTEMAHASRYPQGAAHQSVGKTRKSRSSHVTELMHQLREVAAEKLNADGSQADVLEAVLAFLKDDTTPTIVTSVESFGSTFKWFTSEIDRLRQQVEQLTIERDRALNQAHDLEELETLRAENQAMKAELAQFQQLRQLLAGGVANPSPAVAPTLGAAAPFVTTPTRRATTPTEPTQRRVRNDEQALSLVNEAINLILAWNNTPGREFDEKWYISFPVLQQLLRSSGYSASQPRLQQALKERETEIEQHHQHHGLGQRHNVRHVRTIDEDISM
jgi:integrase